MTTRPSALGRDSVITRKGDLLTTEIDGELLAMSIEDGACYGLNRVGARVWALIAEPRSIEAVCVRLRAEFDVDEDICLTQVTALVQDLRAQNLVTVGRG